MIYSENDTGVTLRKTKYKNKGIQHTHSIKHMKNWNEKGCGQAKQNAAGKNSEARQAEKI